MQTMKQAISDLEDALRNLQRAGEKIVQAPVAWAYVNKDGECEQIEWGDIFNDPSIIPLYAHPQLSRNWAGLMRGVRVEGNRVIITVRGGNDEARELCAELIQEMNT
jgi:hypothetical protein